MASSPQRRRVSQRAPKCCQLCTRRKLKCSKDIPCSNCVLRGKETECQPEKVVLSRETAKTRDAQSAGIVEQGPHTRAVSAEVDSQSPSTPQTDRTRVIGVLSPREEAFGEQSLTAAESISSHLVPTSRDPLPADTVVSLESVVWGSHLGSRGNTNLWSPDDVVAVDNITAVQEQAILDFHQEQISWLHNVIHIDSFKWQCIEARTTGRILGPEWKALYYAMMSVGLYYMGQRMGTAIEIPNTAMLSKVLYWKTLDALHEADYMANHSLYALQAICLIVPCAYAFGDSKRIIVLLSTASSIGQFMQLHHLAETTSTASIAAHVEHEVSKRVWCFLVIQDAYLISFKKTYNIRLEQSTSPLPKNCPEDTSTWDTFGQVPDLALDNPTRTSYMILQFKMTCIKRKLHDETHDLRRESTEQVVTRYEKVIQADEELEALRRDLPVWMKQVTCALDTPLWVVNQWRTFRISYSHMRLSIHRAFFCLSFTDKRFAFSQVACLNAARLLLQTYQDTAKIGEDDKTLADGWTILPHVVSATIVLALNMLLTNEMDGFDPHARGVLTHDEQVMAECLALITATPSAQLSRVVKRGCILISRLLEKSRQRRGAGHELTAPPLSPEEVVHLIQDVEDTMLAEDETALTAFNLSFGEFLHLFNSDSVNIL